MMTFVENPGSNFQEIKRIDELEARLVALEKRVDDLEPVEVVITPENDPATPNE